MIKEMKILIIDSDPAEINERKKANFGMTTGEGYASALRACRDDLQITIVCPYDGDPLPDPTEYEGVIFTGSAVGWSTDAPQQAPLVAAMRRCFDAKRPVMGSCNGMQLAATVLGGSNRASPNGSEDGLARDIRLTEAGRTHPFLAGRQDEYAAPTVHRDEVAKLPDGAVLLATNDHSAVQAFAYERDGIRFWGVQYHPEYTLAYIGKGMRDWNKLPKDIAADIAIADTDRAAAARLGVRFTDMQPEMRMTELRNWLASL
jgi:GMP synthase (glutamine-hydrolysing)